MSKNDVKIAFKWYRLFFIYVRNGSLERPKTTQRQENTKKCRKTPEKHWETQKNA